MWGTFLALGAYHGINPGMGWLFAVALGMQEERQQAVWRSLPPLALGHALAVGSALLVAAIFGALIPLEWLKWGVAAVLIAFGVWRLRRNRHPRFGGMQVSLRELVIWSFLMASAHGAGLMIVPVFLGLEATPQDAQASATMVVLATLVHTLSYLAVAGLVAWLVYVKFGVLFLRRGWFNLELVWAVALIITGVATVAL